MENKTLRMASVEEREQYQREYLEECRAWAEANQPAIATLKAKLFAIAGNAISPQPCPFISTIASDGQLIGFPSYSAGWVEIIVTTMLLGFGTSGTNVLNSSSLEAFLY
jgi:hypothetical protein